MLFYVSGFAYLFELMVKSPSSPFGPSDNNGCCLSCGYTWCETLNECVRVWETYCESLDNGH